MVEHAAARQRTASTTSLNAMPWLPQLPEAWATEIYEQITAYERTLIAPTGAIAEYITGTASCENDLKIVGDQPNGILFSAEHATRPIRTLPDRRGAADAGTGGMTALLAQNYGVGIIANGRQTSNASLVDKHPLKDALRSYLPAACGYVSVHGMYAGKFVRPDDACNLHISIGLGKNPAPPEAMTFAERLVSMAHDMGLYAIIGNRQQYYTQLRDSVALQREADGSARRHELAAFRPQTTVNYVRGLPEAEIGTKTALQIELTSLLRPPIAACRFASRRSEIIGVALGYRFMESVAHLVRKQTLADSLS